MVSMLQRITRRRLHVCVLVEPLSLFGYVLSVSNCAFGLVNDIPLCIPHDCCRMYLIQRPDHAQTRIQSITPPIMSCNISRSSWIETSVVTP